MRAVEFVVANEVHINFADDEIDFNQVSNETLFALHDFIFANKPLPVKMSSIEKLPALQCEIDALTDLFERVLIISEKRPGKNPLKVTYVLNNEFWTNIFYVVFRLLANKSNNKRYIASVTEIDFNEVFDDTFLALHSFTIANKSLPIKISSIERAQALQGEIDALTDWPERNWFISEKQPAHDLFKVTYILSNELWKNIFFEVFRFLAIMSNNKMHANKSNDEYEGASITEIIEDEKKKKKMCVMGTMQVMKIVS